MPALTPRLRRTVCLVAQGYLNKQIAYEMGITEHTAKQYVYEAAKRLRLPDWRSRDTRVLLTRYALRRLRS